MFISKLSRPRLHIIEDNEFDIDLLENFLEQVLMPNNLNFETIYSNYYHTAVDRLQNSDEKRDLVFLDLGLPDSKGIETFRNLKAQFPNHFYVVMSGSIDPDVQATAMQYGCDFFIGKEDLGPDIVSEAIKKFIKSRIKKSKTSQPVS